MTNEHNDIENDDLDNVEPIEQATQAQEETPAAAEADDEMEKVLAANADLKDKLLRAMAEMDNLRKRGVKEREDAQKYGVANLAKELLAVADNLGRAVDAVPAELAAESDAIANLMTGVQATQSQLTNAMAKSGIQPILAEPGTPFDPNLHEVMFEVESPEHAPGSIVQIMETGYTIHDRLLRPARVGVAKKSAGGNDPQVNVEA